MAKLDLTSEQWCELVFEGRNKDYGAYYLRRSSSVRHNKAMLIVMVVAVVCITLPYLIKAVMPVQQTKEVITEVTTLSQLPSRSEERGDQKGQCCSASTFEEHD